MDIVTLGEFLIDMFPAEDGRRLTDVSAFHPKPGGAPANVAVAAKRLGVETAFIGKVGDDAFGHHLAEVLKAEAISLQGLRFDDEARTTMAFIAKPDEHHAEFVFYRNPGADTRLKPEDLDAELIQSATILHFGSLSLSHEPSRSATVKAVEIAKEAGVMISFDFNFRPPLWPSKAEALDAISTVLPHVDLIKLNEDEIQLVSGYQTETFEPEELEQLTTRVLERGPSACVVTLGPQGSYYRLTDQSRFIAGFPVKTIDAVGSGDSFIAGVLTQIVKSGGWPGNLTGEVFDQALRYGNAAGAITATQMGVIPALPTSEQVDHFIQTQGN